MKPIQLGSISLPDEALKKDRKNCKRFGPCGVGEKALYLNSFYIERRYYIPIDNIERVFKRIAMSKGGFSGKGVFAALAYLVVVYEGGKEKQCLFKYEEQVDLMLAHLAKIRPGLPLHSVEAQKRMEQKRREREAKKLPKLTSEAAEGIARLKHAKSYLEDKMELSVELSQSARRKRAFLQSKPAYRQAALAVTLLGVAAFIYGVISMVQKTDGFAVYFTLFGLAAIFLFSGYSMLPTARNNRRAIMERASRAVQNMEQYIAKYRGPGAFPLPAYYAHPIVLARMIRALEEGRGVTVNEALEAVKAELKALNADVEVDQEEYDEVVTVKALFLNEDYR